MRFVTEEYLTSLRPGHEQLSETDSGTGIVEVRVDPNAPRFDIEVVSDLLIGGLPPKSPAGYSEAEAEGLRESLVDRFSQLRKAFNDPRPADLLVNCGDLVVGRRDTEEPELRRVQSAYAEICVPAFRQLLGSSRVQQSAPNTAMPSGFLSVPGNEDAYRGGGEICGPWAKADPSALDTDARDAYPYYSDFVSSFVSGAMPPKNPESHPVASVFRVTGREADPAGGLERAPIAYVAIIGFDSNDMQYGHDLVSNYGQISEEQLQWSRRLIDELRNGAALSTPLYVIAVTHHNLLPAEDRIVHAPRATDDKRVTEFQGIISRGTGRVCEPLSRFCVTNHFLAGNGVSLTSNASGFLDHCQKMRISSVIHGNMHQRAAATLTEMPLVAGRPATELTVLAAPAFAPGRQTSGMARISLDLWKGEAEVAFNYDSGPDGGHEGGPIQIIRPLKSASRVSAAERRLYTKIAGLVAAELSDGPAEKREEVQEYADYVATVWSRDGYAPVSFPDGSLPDLGLPTRQNRYFLLLLLREVKGRNYEMLLSRHTAVRSSEVAEWDTLLMPAFGSVRELMERLRLDVVRQVATQAEDMERASNAKEFAATVERILAGTGILEEDIWLDKIRQVETVNKTKISPTTGEITDYEYRLVVLTPFVRDLTSSNDSPDLSDEMAVVGWLDELPSLRAPGAPLEGRKTIPMEAIMPDGAGLRWEPSLDPVDPDDVRDDDERRRVALPPGLVWFPVRDTDEPEGLWTKAPSILARNADVMRWVEDVMTDRRLASGLFPPHIVLGQMAENIGYSLSEGPFPFAIPDTYDPSEEHLATSTTEAMQRVQYTSSYDLRGKRPYQDKDIRRVVLARRVIRTRGGRERQVISVFDAAGGEGLDADISRFETCPCDIDHGFLGILRPTQRYVLKAGLQRAERVNDFLAAQCAADPWGFVRAKYEGAGEPVALTPPIVEELYLDDWETDGEYQTEFVLCDGNHRVVQKVWNERKATAAIGAIGQPHEPYYAHPFSSFEWNITATSVLSVTPDARWRYAPRPVDIDRLAITDEARRELRGKSAESLYRRYYRDLTFGFGPMGGQGGRYA
jgi:hypothetical protein